MGYQRLQQATSTRTTLLLVIIGLVSLDPDRVGVASESKCTVVIETISVTLNLSPSVCGHSSVTIDNIERGSCSNNGDNCINYDYRDTTLPKEQFCVPLSKTTVTGDKTLTGPNNCEEVVTYTFANVTDCECEVIVASPPAIQYHFN